MATPAFAAGACFVATSCGCRRSCCATGTVQQLAAAHQAAEDRAGDAQRVDLADELVAVRAARARA